MIRSHNQFELNHNQKKLLYMHLVISLIRFYYIFYYNLIEY